MTVTMMMLNIKTTTITPPMITAVLSAVELSVVESSAWSSVPVEIMMSWLIYQCCLFL